MTRPNGSVIWFCVLFLLTASVCVGMFGVRPLRAAPQSQLKANLDLINAKEQTFINYQKDFNDFSKALGNSDEWNVVHDFGVIAERVTGYLDATSALLLAYNVIECDSDRTAVAPIVLNQLSTYEKLLDSETQELNLGLTITRTAGVAATANQMREDIRSARTALVAATKLNGSR